LAETQKYGRDQTAEKESLSRKADETLKLRYVYHFVSNQTQQVGDVNGHTMGLSRIPGIVFFPDGSTAQP
jgi:hypothetical protein